MHTYEPLLARTGAVHQPTVLLLVALLDHTGVSWLDKWGDQRGMMHMVPTAWALLVLLLWPGCYRQPVHHSGSGAQHLQHLHLHAVRICAAAAGVWNQLAIQQDSSPCIELQDVLVVQRMHGPDLSVQNRQEVSSPARWWCCNLSLLQLNLV
jgi:hypothetical protein